ncbi:MULTISPECIES: hypothetical protein [unclassified Streptomyces]|uniref:hypothetical protein n=1 Tax=unclassified Streptomyces TaxID=2593676 RepID=UPI003D9110A2
MTRLEKRLAGILLALIAVAVVVSIVLHSSNGDRSGLDGRSYKAGYHSFGDAYLPKSDEDRKTTEAQCNDTWWREATKGDDQAGTYDKHSWVVGCADYLEQRKSRF